MNAFNIPISFQNNNSFHIYYTCHYKISEELKSIAMKLYEKPNSIEELTDLREWISTVPDKLEERQEYIDKAVSDYELIDLFFYNLSADDFNTKYVSCVTCSFDFISFYYHSMIFLIKLTF